MGSETQLEAFLRSHQHCPAESLRLTARHSLARAIHLAQPWLVKWSKCSDKTLFQTLIALRHAAAINRCTEHLWIRSRGAAYEAR